MNQPVLSAMAVAACAAAPVLAQSQPPVPGEQPSAYQRYDMNYVSSDDRVQAFDDGRVTRLLLPEGTLVPSVVSIKPQGEVLLPMSKEPPYLVLDGLHGKLVLNWANQRKVGITYRGQLALDKRSGQGAAFGSVPVAASFGAAARPTETTPAVMRPKPTETPSLPATAPQASTPAVLPVSVLAETASAPATPGPAPAAGVPLAQWRIVTTDETLSAALSRWSAISGYQIVWQAPKDLPVYPAAYTGSFEAVVEAVMKDTAMGGYPLHACVYDNKVVRVLHATQSCAR